MALIDFIILLVLAYAIYAIRTRMKLKRRIEELQRNQRRERMGSQRVGTENSEYEVLKGERYYAEVLGLSGSITRQEIKKRYRDLVALYHPDKVTHLGPKLQRVAEEEMKEINESYAFFKKQYDIR